MNISKKHFPYILAVILSILIIWSAINPFDRTNWIAEISQIFLVFGLFSLTLNKFRFSNTSYFIMFLWLIIHTIGAHYTFEYVPIDCITDFFGFERNHYDRLAHFAIGLYAFPIAEYVERSKFIKNKKAIILFSLFAIISLAGIFEVIEWVYAELFGGEQAQNFLGSQGDIWDAQKDIVADTLGAITALIVYKIISWKNS